MRLYSRDQPLSPDSGFTERYLDLQLLPGSHNFNCDRLSRFIVEEGVDEGLILKRDISDSGDDISFAHTSPGSRAFGIDLRDEYTPFDWQAVGLRQAWREGLPSNAQVRAGNVTLLDDLSSNRFCRIDGDGKTEAFSDCASQTSAYDYGINTDNFACQVDQRTARIALVDGGIRLDQVFEPVALAGIQRSAECTDYAHGHGVHKFAQR